METKDVVAFWNEVHTLVDDAMKSHDRMVSIFFHPEDGFSVIVSPVQSDGPVQGVAD